MRNKKESLPILIFILLTFLNYILGVWSVECSILIGGSSTTQLLLLVFDIEKKILFPVYVIYVVAFWLCLILSIVTSNRKIKAYLFMSVLSIDVIAFVGMTVYKLAINNYMSLSLCFIGIIVKIVYIIWSTVYMMRLWHGSTS